MKKLTLGLAPVRRFCFSKEDSHRYKKLLEDRLKELSVDFVNLDGINEEGLLIGRSDVKPAVDLLKKADVDCVFFPHVNFGTEDVVADVAKALGKPVLLWGPRDENPMPDGIRLRDTQCGLFATSNVFKKRGIPFTYITNSRLDAPVFERGLKNFLAAVRVSRGFLNARVGQIGTRPGNFHTVIINEQELTNRFGVEIVPVGVGRVIKAIGQIAKDDPRVPEESEKIRSSIRVAKGGDEVLRKTAAFKLFMEDWAKNEGLSAIAVYCHDEFAEDSGFYSCFANGMLTDMGIPVACETDIHGALSSVILQNAAADLTGDFRPVFLADMTIRHPSNNNAELLWHCGNFPFSLCDPACADAHIGGHCNIPPGLPGTGNFRIKGGDLTVTRFDGQNGEYSLFMGQGKSTDGPYNQGSYVWMEVPNWPLWEEKLICGPYIHHVSGVHGHFSAALYEATKYIPGLKPDPAQPTEEEIRAYLRGDDVNV
ncbi:MAG: L-fucose/L-arabinose isomerase family protein [Defluviitaleaceae bacterium]|nr:L-fucose/L-arabinose isomerase family protein [Defluviitaleaceae bacterium]